MFMRSKKRIKMWRRAQSKMIKRMYPEILTRSSADVATKTKKKIELLVSQKLC